ncbi:hypothetical protein P3S67_028372 [Capsicum chacoense]
MNWHNVHIFQPILRISKICIFNLIIYHIYSYCSSGSSQFLVLPLYTHHDNNGATLVLFLSHFPHEEMFFNISIRKFISPTNIEKGRVVDHLSKINETTGQDTSGSKTNESANQICDNMFAHLDNLSIKSPTIFKVNVGLRESNPGAFTPKMVSIGPYHKKDSQLWQMEKYKVLYLRRFLQRKEELGVESCISELMELKEEALKCYDDIENYGHDMNKILSTGSDSIGVLNYYISCIADRFLQMLLLDGCFVVGFIRELQEEYPQGEDKIINTNVGCIRDQVTRDLMLLENQLPFFILDKLHRMTKQDNELPFAIMAKRCFHINLPKGTPLALLELFYNANARKIKHLLHLGQTHR